MLNKGFTLTELLIVIAILGFLATVGVASYTGSRDRARDGRRRADIDAIANAMELDYSGAECSPGRYEYPADYTACSGLFDGDPPTDPAGGDYLYSQPGGSGTFRVCADLEEDDSWDGTEEDFCRQNKQ